MSYELLHEDENSYHVKHPDGRKIQIAKSAISDAVHGKIKSFYSGGPVRSEAKEDDSSLDPSLAALGMKKEDPLLGKSSSAIEPDSKESSLLSDVGAGLKQSRDSILTSLPESPNFADPTKPEAAPMMSDYYQSSQVVPQQAPQTGLIASNDKIPGDAIPIQPAVKIGGESVTRNADDATGAGGVPANSKDMGLENIKGVQKQLQDAYHAESVAKQNLANKQADILAGANSQRIEADNAHAEIMSKISRNMEDVGRKYAAQEIKPNQLWNDSSTGGKIAASIGLILGGIGAGLTGGPNQALGMINKMIDRDIDAQKANLGKKQTLYSMYLQQTHNEQAAYQMTKLAQAGAVQGQLQYEAAKNGSPMAKAAEQMFMSQSNKDLLPLINENAKFHMAQNLIYGQGGGSETPSQRAARAAEILLTPEQRERMIQIPGPNGQVLMRPTPSKADADKFRSSEVEFDQIQSDITRARKFMQNTGRTVWGSDNDTTATGIEKSMLGSMNKLMQINRFTEGEMENIFKPLVVNPGAFRQGKAEKMLDVLEEKIQDNRNAMYKQYVPGYDPGKSKDLETAPAKRR